MQWVANRLCAFSTGGGTVGSLVCCRFGVVWPRTAKDLVVVGASAAWL